MLKMKKNTGITLIALVITIIIMLILAGIVIAQLTGENGLITNSKKSKEIYEYTAAKEEINLTLMSVVAKCEEKGVSYSIDEIIDSIKSDNEKEIEKMFNTNIGSIKAGAEIVNPSDIVITVKKYSKYKFLVGQKEGTNEVEGIKGVTTEEVTLTTEKSSFQEVNDFEKSILNGQSKNEYKIKYNANGGTGAPGTQTKEKGVILKLSTTEPTKSGYAFIGWATTSNGEVKYNSGDDYIADESITLYAKWTQISYLYNEGKTIQGATWSWVGGHDTSSPGTTFGTDFMTIDGTYSRYWCIGAMAKTNSKILLNGAKKLTMEWECIQVKGARGGESVGATAGVFFGYGSTTEGNFGAVKLINSDYKSYAVTGLAQINENTEGVPELNHKYKTVVSLNNLTDSYLIGIRTTGYKINVYKVWLEY